MKLTLSPFRYPVQPAALNSGYSDTVSTPAEPSHQPAPQAPKPVVNARQAVLDLDYRGLHFQRLRSTTDRISAQGQQAVLAYNSITELEERTRLNELFGFSEYA